MTDLYIVHSALQLMVAQLVVSQRPTTRRVLWVSTPDAARRAAPTLAAVLRQDTWDDVRWVPHNHQLGRPDPRTLAAAPFSTLGRLRGHIDDVERCLDDASPHQVLVPHAQNWHCLAAARWCARRHRVAHLYEEGLSLYYATDGFTRRRSPSAATAAHAVQRLVDGAMRSAGLFSSSDRADRYLSDVYCFFPDRPQVVHPRGERVRILPNRNLLEEMGSAEAFAPTRAYLRSLRRPGTACLLVSSIDVEDLFVAAPAYLRGMQRAIGRLLGEHDRIFVKRHPRNDPARLAQLLAPYSTRVVLLDEPVPVPLELCFADLGVGTVAGTLSSPLVYLPLLYDVRPVSVAPYVLREAERQQVPTERYRGMMKKLETAFGPQLNWYDEGSLR